MDEDYVEQREVIEMSDVIKLMKDCNDINKRFMWVIAIALICFTVMVGSLAGFYFLGNNHSGVDQKAVQSEGRQEVHQSIIK